MYIRSVEIEAIRSVARLSWRLDGDQLAGWHVFLGANGSGKSTVLCSIALALIGAVNIQALRQGGQNWVTGGAHSGAVRLRLVRDGRRILRRDLLGPAGLSG